MADANLREETALELLRRRELIGVLAAMDAAGVQPLVFKGAALAHTHYPIPAARPHLDVDLIVDEQDVGSADRVLTALGYHRPLRISGTLIKSQATYLREDAYEVLHTMDLHWKVSIPQVFAELFSFEELASSSVPLPAAGASARAVGPVHALAIACIHRVAHHPGQDRAMWLYDIHLLASGLSEAQVGEFIALLERKAIRHVGRDGILRAQRQFNTKLPQGLASALGRVAASCPDEPSAAYLRPGLRPIDGLVSDLSALRTWRQRARLVREHLLPPASYMQQTYGTTAPALLPLLYAWRAMKGAGRWFS